MSVFYDALRKYCMGKACFLDAASALRLPETLSLFDGDSDSALTCTFHVLRISGDLHYSKGNIRIFTALRPHQLCLSPLAAEEVNDSIFPPQTGEEWSCNQDRVIAPGKTAHNGLSGISFSDPCLIGIFCLQRTPFCSFPFRFRC
jgi:hypothetical protein